MKIDRLLGLTIYLLNHGKCSAKKLSERFEVSARTIMRDMDTLCMAGIPVVSTFGVEGGYEIQDGYVMNSQVVNEKDYSYIISALQGLASAYSSQELDATIEKMNSLTTSMDQGMVMDLSVAREKRSVNELLYLLANAIKKKHVLEFTYTNARNETSVVQIEPVYTVYQWYNWYLIGYRKEQNDYRMYKLIRMEKVRLSDQENSREHVVSEVQKQLSEVPDSRKLISFRLHCKKKVCTKCIEYLNGTILKEYDNGDMDYACTLPEGETFWYGVLLSLGEDVCVLEPQSLRKQMVTDCKRIIEMYQEDEQGD